jgi:hypothetical protein
MNQIAIYQSESGAVDVRLDGDTVWLSLQQMADLFGRDKSVISRHLRNVFSEGELERPAVVAKNATTAADGKTYQVEYFNLDAILSVGYRVNSVQGTRFRQWATRLLREHLTRGYTLNQQRLHTNAAELEAALQLVRKAAQTPELNAQGHPVINDTGLAALALLVAESDPAQKEVLIRLVMHMLAQGGQA